MELKWSDEAMAAINTHLCLLQRGRRAAFLDEEEVEASEHDHYYELDNASFKRMRMTVLSPGDDSISRGDNNAAANIVDLASQLPLPLGWEQFLDLRSGQVYYIDWKSCRRSYDDPRRAFHETASSSQSCGGIPSLRWELTYKPSPDHELSDISSECVSGVCDETKMCSIIDPKHMKSISEDVNISIATSPLLDEDWDLMRSRGWLPLIATDDDHSEISSASINAAISVAEKKEASVKQEEEEESEEEEKQGIADCDDDADSVEVKKGTSVKQEEEEESDDDGNNGENRVLEITQEENDDMPCRLLSSRNSSLCAHCGFVYDRRRI